MGERGKDHPENGEGGDEPTQLRSEQVSKGSEGDDESGSQTHTGGQVTGGWNVPLLE